MQQPGATVATVMSLWGRLKGVGLGAGPLILLLELILCWPGLLFPVLLE